MSSSWSAEGNESYSNLFVSVLYHFIDDSSTHSLCSCHVSQTLEVSVRDSCYGLRVVDFTTEPQPFAHQTLQQTPQQTLDK